MNTWFECKVRYQKMEESGKERTVNEPYLIDAISFTEAEARINKEMEPYITGDFSVTNIKIANFSEILSEDTGDRWFKCKVSFVTIDEEKGVERKSNTYMLVQANNVKEAYGYIEEFMQGSTSEYTIPSIAESPIMDVFPYFDGEESLNPDIPDNLKPIEKEDNGPEESVDEENIDQDEDI